MISRKNHMMKNKSLLLFEEIAVAVIFTRYKALQFQTSDKHTRSCKFRNRDQAEEVAEGHLRFSYA